jgi:hypothetical protein
MSSKRCHAPSLNYPNPFNPSTTIQFSLPSSGPTPAKGRDGVGSYEVTLTIYNALGQEVEKLVDGVREPGTYSVTWDASHLASGVYYYRLVAGDFEATRKLLLIR